MSLLWFGVFNVINNFSCEGAWEITVPLEESFLSLKEREREREKKRKKRRKEKRKTEYS